MKLGFRTLGATLLIVIVGMPFTATAARAAEEQKCLRSEIEQMLQSVAEKLKDAAAKLDLTDEQKSKIGEIEAKDAEQRTALRTERKALLQDELKALGSILTAEQREKIKEFAEDKMEQVRATTPGLPRFAAARDTLAERAQSAAEKLGLTSEQRQK